jgi:carbonic anhydrase
MHSSILHPETSHSSCTSCAELLSANFGRRRFLQVTAGGLALAAFAPMGVLAATGKYEAMVLSCIDPRFQELVSKYTASRKLTGKYSQFTMAGAAVGVVAPVFKDWHKTFWDNLGASIQLHKIEKVIVINHRDCGAAKIAYGEAAVTNREAETKTHREAFALFRAEMATRHPSLGIETGLMDLGGKLENIA